MPLWTPTEITTALWLDGADSATLTLESGAYSQWADKSGNTRHATQGTSTKRPAPGSLGGLNALSFAGDDVLLTNELFDAGAAAATLCIVLSSTASNVGGLLSTRPLVGNSGWSLRSNSATTAVYYHTGFSPNLNMTTASGAKLLVVTRDGLAAFASVDGVSGAVVTTGGYAYSSYGYTSIGAEQGGAHSYFNGLIAEIVLLPVAADTTTRQLLEGYLAHKWGMAASLPVGHPYKAAAPGWAGPVGASLGQLWVLSPSTGERLAEPLVQGWLLLDAAGQGLLTQPWGLRLGRDLVEPWSNAPVRVSGLAQPWRDAGELARPLVQPWQDAAPLAAGLAQEWDILGALASGLVQPWAVAAEAALVGPLVQGWDLRDVVPLSADLAQPWSIGTDPAHLRYTLAVTIDGHAVQVDSLTLEADLDQDAIHCTLSLGDLADYQRCRDLAPVVVQVAVNGGAAETYHLVLTSARIDERHGDTRYEVQAESALVLLGEPYAEPVSVEEYTGAASVIAATLCAPLTLSWQTVDWTLPAGALVAAGETPLQLLKRLAASVGAVVQARPDGSVLVVPEYPVSLPAWARTAPDLVWIETERSEQVAGQPERRSGANKFLIGETLTAADSLRLEEETVSETVKIVRGYQVPWNGQFALVHTGGSWVQVEDLGIETRQEVETIEIVAGEGRVRYPILSRDAVRWLHVSLGALTVSEDGTVRADVAGQSLCEMTYTTRCRKWRVRDGRNESLQLVAEI